MDAHVSLTDLTKTIMAVDGSVRIPLAMRERAGLVADGPVRLAINDRDELVVLPGEPHPQETSEQRRVRIRAAIESVRGTVSTGFATTDEYMDFIRPHRLDPE